MRSGMPGSTLLLVFALRAAGSAATAPVDYDIVYVRMPRAGDSTFVRFPEVFNPVAVSPGSDLVLLHPDGSEEVLFPAGHGAVLDPVVSFDAKTVFFSYVPDATDVNDQRGDAPRGGADIYKIDLATRQSVRLTQQVWSPPSGAAPWSANHLAPSAPGTVYLGYGIFNLSPCPIPGGRLLFVSSRDGYLPNKGYTFPNLRLYVMDEDGRNVEAVGHLNVGSALHPTVLADGRVMFSSFETQGVRDSRVWALWSVWPDGRRFEPLFSAFKSGAAMHFQTQLSDGRIAVVEYYNLNNNGFGTLLAFDARKDPDAVPFGSPDASDPSNPAVRRGIWFFDPSHPEHLQPRFTSYRFSPPGLVALSAFTHGEDEASSKLPDGSDWAGKVTHPAGAPNNDVLLVWTPGPANNLDRPVHLPRVDAGIYLLKAGVPLNDSRQLVLVKNDPRYNEVQPRPVVSYAAIHGVSEPAALPWLPNDGAESPSLPAGTPFGLVGTSSLLNRNTTPGVAPGTWSSLDAFNTTENDENPNWVNQGADAGRYGDDDVFAVRLLAMEGVAHRSYGPGAGATPFFTHGGTERLRILGEIPVRHLDAGGAPLLGPDGKPDTSFLARIPADTPFTFQTLDKDGLVLNMAQTWHQVRPGEARWDCGGCHAHNKMPVEFSRTAAARPGYAVADLTGDVPVLTKEASGKTAVKLLASHLLDVEYTRDIRPLLVRSCAPCHSTSGRQEAGLVLDDDVVVDGFAGTYNRLARDPDARYGIPPVIANRAWRQTNASRYVRMFQSRRSLLIWKIFGRRLDGWTNADHPTEAVAGDPSTLPAGVNANDADLDFTGTIMPPPGSGVPLLTEDEKMTFARWIDLGAPATSSDPGLASAGWFSDELKPTLAVSLPRAGVNDGPLDRIRFGAFDDTSGLDRATLSVVASFPVNGHPPGAELAGDLREADGIYTLDLEAPIRDLTDGRVTILVKDKQGNETVVDRSFSVDCAASLPARPCKALDPATLEKGAPGRPIARTR